MVVEEIHSTPKQERILLPEEKLIFSSDGLVKDSFSTLILQIIFVIGWSRIQPNDRKVTILNFQATLVDVAMMILEGVMEGRER